MANLKLAENVTVLDTVTSLDLDTERVLAAAQGKLKEVVLIGYDHDGEFYFASNKASGPQVLWALEQAKLKLLKVST